MNQSIVSSFCFGQIIQRDFIALRQQNKDISQDILHYFITLARSGFLFCFLRLQRFHMIFAHDGIMSFFYFIQIGGVESSGSLSVGRALVANARIGCGAQSPSGTVFSASCKVILQLSELVMWLMFSISLLPMRVLTLRVVFANRFFLRFSDCFVASFLSNHSLFSISIHHQVLFIMPFNIAMIGAGHVGSTISSQLSTVVFIIHFSIHKFGFVFSYVG